MKKTKRKLYPVKRRTYVDFIYEEVKLGEQDGEIVVNLTVRLQLNKIPFGGLYEVYHKRYPFISRSGVWTVTGRAVCGNETFDFEKGKRIAETRAQAKAYSTANKIFEMIREDFDQKAKTAKWIARNCEGCAQDADIHTVELDKEVIE